MLKLERLHIVVEQIEVNSLSSILIQIYTFCVADSLLSVYRGLERFYEQLLPFNVLMCSSAEDHNATAVKGWISKCVVVSEDAFQKLSRRIIYDTVQLENAYIAQLKSKHLGCGHFSVNGVNMANCPYTDMCDT